MWGAGTLVLIVTISVVDIAHSASQSEVDYISKWLRINYDVVDNLKDANTYKVDLTFTNGGTGTISHGDWGIYFCNIRMVEPTHPGAYDDVTRGVKVTHITGCLFKLETTSAFKSLKAGEKLVMPLTMQHWAVARTDVMPNWYIWANSLNAKIIESTAGEDLKFVGPFDTKEKWKRYATDMYDPFTPEKRFQLNLDNLGQDKVKSAYTIVPTPLQMNVEASATVQLRSGEWKVSVDPALNLSVEADIVKNQILKGQGSGTPTKNIVLSVNIEPGQSTEGYNLTVGESEVRITGRSAAGVFYGIQSLIQLANDEGSVPKVTISDWPRYEYRGMMIDVSRNFHDKTVVKKLLDAMAIYKLNKLHFHLTDDEGWRVEIKSYPWLTQVGAKNCPDVTESECVLPQLGSNPNGQAKFYTTVDYREILQYANDRHIQVIPEIDMPGHSHAAIKVQAAMVKQGKSNLSLYEEDDRSEYTSPQIFTDNAINPCLNTTYIFIERVIDDLIELHRGIQPLKIFHYGGDEVASGAWMNSTACKGLVSRLGKKLDQDPLMEYFAQRVSEITHRKGLNLGAWEDGLIGEKEKPYNRSDFTNPRIHINAWNNIWEWGQGSRAYIMANAGYEVVMSQATHLYFDHPEEPDPEERGYYWATRYTDTHKTFSFTPDNLYNNIDTERSGKAIDKEKFCQTVGACPPLTKADNIIGMQGQLWSETSRTSDQLSAFIFPRMTAMAERAWHKALWEEETDQSTMRTERLADWRKFAKFLATKGAKQMEWIGFKPYIPVPGAKKENGKLSINVAFPGLGLEYSMDGGATWMTYVKSVDVKGSVIKLRTVSGRLKSRIVELKASTTSDACPAFKWSAVHFLLVGFLNFLT